MLIPFEALTIGLFLRVEPSAANDEQGRSEHGPRMAGAQRYPSPTTLFIDTYGPRPPLSVERQASHIEL